MIVGYSIQNFDAVRKTSAILNLTGSLSTFEVIEFYPHFQRYDKNILTFRI